MRTLWMRGIRWIICAAIVWVFLTPVAVTQAVQPGAVAWPNLSLKQITFGLVNPVSMTHADDGSNRIFIVQQNGQIVILQGGSVLSQPFLDVHNLVSCCGEQGLLGLAFPPGYASKGHFFIYYTNLSGDIVVARYQVSANANLANANSGVIVLTIPHPSFTNHDGGQLAFGPEGALYIGVGDGGSGGDPNNHGQSLNTLLGKILRIDVEGAGCVQSPPKAVNYCIPSNNPFVSTAGARGEIWAYGLRNPWRFSFDRQTGDLYIGDVGQDIEEEIDFQPAGSAGGQNYGWKILEGNLCFSPSSGCVPPTGYVAPVTTYDHGANDSNGCSITGGMVYRGPDVYLNMRGVYFYGDFCQGKIYGLVNSGGWQTQLLSDQGFSIPSFGEDEAGNLYVIDYGGGRIFQITADPNPSILAHHLYMPQARH